VRYPSVTYRWRERSPSLIPKCKASIKLLAFFYSFLLNLFRSLKLLRPVDELFFGYICPVFLFYVGKAFWQSISLSDPGRGSRLQQNISPMRYTCQSEIGKIRSVFIKRAADAFESEEKVAHDWGNLNFLEPPSFEQSLAQYQAFESLVLGVASEVRLFAKDSEVTIDSIYCRDSSIATDRGIILCRMGKPARAGEPHAVKKVYEAHGMEIFGEISGGGTLEGGDVVWLDQQTLAVGLTYRSNIEGINQLKLLLDPLGVTLIPVHLPHYRGPSDVFHLMSILSPLDKDLALIYSPLMPIAFRNDLLCRGYKLIELPEDEFDSMGCNVLALSPLECLMVAGNPKTQAVLEKAGCRVKTYEGSEISLKGGGGPTCLTRPILREV
jgi:N-dimethylarginine dimethylaminohydrolase